MTAQSVQPSAASLASIAVCAAGILLLTTMDAAMKGLVLAVGVFNTLLWRTVVVTAASGVVWAAGRRARPRPEALRLHLLRGAIIAVVALSFFWGLGRLPMAEAIALSFIAPLIALYLAAVLLGERIGRVAVWGSLAGMAGVVTILAGKAGAATLDGDAAWGALAILGSAVFYAYNIILSRRQAQVAGPVEVALFQNLTLLGLLALAAPWLASWLPAEQWRMVALAAALSLAGQLMLTWSFARAEAQYLIPIEYTAFVWAVLLGWIVFGETIGWSTVLGAAFIVGGCLLVAIRRPKAVTPLETTEI